MMLWLKIKLLLILFKDAQMKPQKTTTRVQKKTTALVSTLNQFLDVQTLMP